MVWIVKCDFKLSPDAIRAIEEILADGSTAEVRASENGITVTRIFRKRAFPN